MDLDVTLFFQFAIVAMLMLVLRGGLFKPLLAVMEARHQKIHGTRHETERLERLSAADRDAYDQRLREARRAAQAAREAQRQGGRDEARRILAEARAAIAKSLNETRESIAANERAMAQTLESDVDSVAHALVTKLLGRETA